AMRNVMRKGIQIGELDSFVKKAPENAESTEASALMEAEPTQAGIERQVPAAEITGIVTCAARRNMVFGRLFAMGLRQSLGVPIGVIGVNREAPPKMTDQAAEPLQAPPIQETMEQANESRPETAELFQVMASLSSDPAMTGRADWEDLTTEQETVEQANEPMPEVAEPIQDTAEPLQEIAEQELYDEPEEEEQMEKDPLVQTEAVGRMWTEKEKVELPAHEGDRARRPRRAETWACSAQPRGTRLGVMESLNNTFEMNPDKARVPGPVAKFASFILVELINYDPLQEGHALQGVRWAPAAIGGEALQRPLARRQEGFLEKQKTLRKKVAAEHPALIKKLRNRQAIDKVIEKLQEDDLGIVVSIEHDGVVVRHPDGAAAVTADPWKAGLVKAAEDVGRWRFLGLGRVHFGEFMMSGKECPELLLSELLMHKPVTVDGSEYLLSEVHQTVPESGKAVRVATSSQQAGRWMLHTEAEMEPVFLKTELV
ncbi:unnamed protein product, partial [Symbiodinium sp. CCMP2456]